MPDWKTYETCSRVLTAIFAAYDLKPGANLDKITGYYGTETTKEALHHFLRRVQKDAEQMKQQDTSDGTQSPPATKAAKPAKPTKAAAKAAKSPKAAKASKSVVHAAKEDAEKVKQQDTSDGNQSPPTIKAVKPTKPTKAAAEAAKSPTAAKASKSDVTAEKEDRVMNGRVQKKAIKPAPKRAAKKKTIPELAVVVENGSMSEGDLVEDTNEGNVTMKEGTAKIATATEGDGMSEKDGLEGTNGSLEHVKDEAGDMSESGMDVDKASEED